MNTPQPPSTPKKKSLMPSTELRRRLRAHGHGIDPFVHVGKEGVTRGLVTHLTAALFDHELVKVRLAAECPLDRFAVAEALAALPGVNIAQIVGRTILVYKRHPQEPRFEGKRASTEGTPKV